MTAPSPAAEPPEGLNDNDAAVEDVRAIAVALGLGGHARPYSAHQVVQREILPALAPLLDRAATHGPSFCVPVDDANRVLAEARDSASRFADRAAKAEAAVERVRALIAERRIHPHMHMYEVEQALDGQP